MLFIVKKSIGGLLQPLPLLLLLMGIGLLLLWRTRWQRGGKTLILVSWLTLVLISIQPVADRLLLPLEKHYPTWRQNQPHVNYIVVLGGGYTYNPDWAPSSNLIGNSLPRVTEGIRLYYANPGAKMIFTGAAAQGNPVSSAKTAALVAESLGIPAQDILILDTPRDTEEEAASTAKIVGRQPFLLVTSANHLPRAIRFFQAQGLNPIPAPANQMAITTALNPWEKVFPSAYYLSHSERAWYETLGRLWQSLKGVKAAQNSPDQ
ncbi:MULTISPECIES: envelope biogenesis factor ElyC [unclassified Brenneria]|uniref:envelope biogenesis factor ElyC n=1 Tax=unclassified Brenneria TaxID=2634434 RepID=UPI0015542A0D|nr:MULTISPECIES: envelope biogenesis factor ElyC [unclassified Brenneria]MBJ7220560.1 envelope biogenesis factor ElyC [Brenneria sp. L3-3C-1]MEE3641804.1 envelope biogenesis factor ElyC [Brenneria sp. L3_3C_1]MEE3649565.1 envelope biogenesis factor ElyC [Brenneria sp. HEZEL_4_2_4]NPC99523.1 envelope biogenesis factor ElyC [Brenneria sp. hezel4-2-4]